MSGVKGWKRRAALVAGITLLSLFLLCTLGFASGGEGDGNGKLLDLLYRCINFALLVIILFVVIRKTAVKDFFAARREEIRRKFEGLQAERDAAENRLQELEKKLEEFTSREAEIMEQFKAEGMAEKERIIAGAREKAEQILAQVEVTIQREIQSGRDRLKQQVVDVAAEKARELIAREIRDSDQDHLVDEFIERVEKLH